MVKQVFLAIEIFLILYVSTDHLFVQSHRTDAENVPEIVRFVFPGYAAARLTRATIFVRYAFRRAR